MKLVTDAQDLLEKGDAAGAMRNVNAALRQERGLVEAAMLRANINLRLGKYAEAQKEFNYMVSLHPRSVTLARVLSDRALVLFYVPDRVFSEWPTGD